MNQNSQQEQDRATLAGWEITKKPNNVDVKFVDLLLAAQDRLTEARVRAECAEIIRKKRESVNIFSAETGGMFVSDILKEILIPNPNNHEQN